MTQIVVNKQTEASMLIRYYCSKKKKFSEKKTYKKNMSQKLLL